MSSSGLLVLLPLVGAIAGAIIGAFANSWYREREAKKARDRERNALLLLIDAEVSSHIQIYERLKAGHPRPRSETDPGIIELMTPRTEDWDNSRARLAQLICVDHIKAIVIYYKMLKDLTVSTSPEETKEERIRHLQIFADELNRHAIAIRDKGKKYLKELPDYDRVDL